MILKRDCHELEFAIVSHFWYDWKEFDTKFHYKLAFNLERPGANVINIHGCNFIA
jgi:hypothetical protein